MWDYFKESWLGHMWFQKIVDSGKRVFEQILFMEFPIDSQINSKIGFKKIKPSLYLLY
jgi:hypothetical protein